MGKDRRASPSIIFIDEIDVIGAARGVGEIGKSKDDQTLNQLLSLMDGFDSVPGIIVIGATNRKDILDPALIRPGRFDRIVKVELPNLDSRIALLKAYLSKQPTTGNLNLKEVGEECLGLSGAQLESLVNTSAMAAVRAGRNRICQADLLASLEFERLGPVTITKMTKNTESRIALMEASTALIATLMPTIEDVRLVSIKYRESCPHGKTILNVDLKKKNYSQFTKKLLDEQLLMELAGYAAERIFYGYENASSLNSQRLLNANRIVTKIEVIAAMTNKDEIEMYQTFSYLTNTNLQIFSNYVTEFLMLKVDFNQHHKIYKATTKAKKLLIRNLYVLEILVQQLLVKKELTGTEVRQILI